MLRSTFALLAGTAVGTLALGGIAVAVALPLAPQSAEPAPLGASLVETVHGCHHGLLRDRRYTGTSGWHYHDRACVRHDAAPPGYRNAPSPYGYYYRTPLCRYRCEFIGPLKHCEQWCR